MAYISEPETVSGKILVVIRERCFNVLRLTAIQTAFCVILRHHSGLSTSKYDKKNIQKNSLYIVARRNESTSLHTCL